MNSDWVEKTLFEVTKKSGILTDGDWVESKDQDPSGDVRLIQLADIKDGYFINKSSRYLTSEKALKLNCTYLKEGDILIARMPDPLGRACIYPANDPKAVTVVDVCIVRLENKDCLSKWLMYTINSPQFRNKINSLQSGSTRKRISKKNLSYIPLLVPLRHEQQQIVDEIEKQFTRLDASVKGLKEVKRKLSVYRKSVLKAAFEGRLSFVSEWANIIVKDFGEIITGTTPSTKNSAFYGNEYCFFRPKELDSGYYVKDSIIKLSIKGINRARLLPKKCILVTCIGATIGKTGFNRVEGATNQQINSIIPNKEEDVPELIYYLFISEKMQRQIKDRASSTTLPILNKSKFMKLTAKFPKKINEQKQIVEDIESRFSVIDKLEETVDTALKKAELLRKSILKSAFEGKLVRGNNNG